MSVAQKDGIERSFANQIGYEDLYRRWEHGNWSAYDIDFSNDREGWDSLTDLQREAALWIYSMDAFKKNQWNELEFYTHALTKLQPHFVTPWLFQSWNLAYNVSVESDRPFDKYFYIARGVQLLAEGERREGGD